ncbi:MAG: hypothetical protein ONB44_20580 [candidate division KSB1 bacterium]|nr:hypothetical protein [candidate division KSB1 bacterium]MDZ7304528.1 hypothetical protein [candidate division KSB1 bacterium]MDZ7314430.1 hypothetical protein [candidate division KSB1 bacterium]
MVECGQWAETKKAGLRKGELLISSEIQKILQERREARVILLFEDDEMEWKPPTCAAFLAGFSEKDAASAI